MKVQAFILLIPLTAFLAETISLPLEVTSCKKEFTISSTKKTCMKMVKPIKCHGSKENEPKPSGKCNNTSECSVCPVCFAFTFQPQYENSLQYLFIKKNYGLINAGFPTSYVPPVWKPPNSYSNNS